MRHTIRHVLEMPPNEPSLGTDRATERRGLETGQEDAIREKIRNTRAQWQHLTCMNVASWRCRTFARRKASMACTKSFRYM